MGNERMSPDIDPSQRNSPSLRGPSPELIHVADHEVESVTKQQVSKKVSQINVDKLLIEENLKDYKPFGNKWVNHKDPDIYESDLGLSSTSDENKHLKDGENRLFLNKIQKKPS